MEIVEHILLHLFEYSIRHAVCVYVCDCHTYSWMLATFVHAMYALMETQFRLPAKLYGARFHTAFAIEKTLLQMREMKIYLVNFYHVSEISSFSWIDVCALCGKLFAVVVVLQEVWSPLLCHIPNSLTERMRRGARNAPSILWVPSSFQRWID